MATSCLPQGEIAQPAEPRLTTAVVLKKLAIDLPADVAARLPELSVANFVAPRIGAAPPFLGLSATRAPDDATRAIDCLTAAVYYEARSQSDDGQRAVAQVVLNRVRDRAFPSTVCGVVYQGSQRRTGCQFSFTCDGSMAARRNEASWAHSREIAVSALSGAVYAPVGSATFYHANYVLPYWASSFDKVAVVGAHIFYRWKNGLENALAFRQSYAGYEPSLTGRTGPAATVMAGGTDVSGQEMVHGVTIHRGAASTAPVAIATPGAVPAVVDRPTMGKRIRVMADHAGVTVHRGDSAPPPASEDGTSD